MNKTEAAAALREAANRIEASGYDGDGLAVEIMSFRVEDKEQLAAIIEIADDGTIHQRYNDGTHWARFVIGSIRFIVFYDPAIINYGSVLDLLPAKVEG